MNITTWTQRSDICDQDMTKTSVTWQSSRRDMGDEYMLINKTWLKWVLHVDDQDVTNESYFLTIKMWDKWVLLYGYHGMEQRSTTAGFPAKYIPTSTKSAFSMNRVIMVPPSLVDGHFSLASWAVSKLITYNNMTKARKGMFVTLRIKWRVKKRIMSNSKSVFTYSFF